jgi:Protein of unknown function with PCYCGC motif
MDKKQAQKSYPNRPPERRTQAPSSGSALKSLLLILIPALLVLGTGSYFLFLQPDGGAKTVGSASASSGSAATSQAASSGGATAQNVSLPSYVKGSEMTQAYQFAVDRPDVLDYVPCFCGCGRHSGHKSNKNCFVKSAQTGQTNGKIAFDEHGANCDMCIKLATDAKRMTAEGKSLKEIRQYVEGKYGNTGETTDAPWPTT